MKKQQAISFVTQKLAYWCTLVKLNNLSMYTDINRYSEGFVERIFSILDDCDYMNMNQKEMNFPGIDIGDVITGKAIQVTSRRDGDKIKDTYTKLYNPQNARHGQLLSDIFFGRVVFFIISDEKHTNFQERTLKEIAELSHGRFNKDTDIITVTDLIATLENLYDSNYAKFSRIYKLIDQQLDDLPNIPSDRVVVEELVSCFKRPAFLESFYGEMNLWDFEKAMKETASLLSTGKTSQQQNIKYTIDDINESYLRNKFRKILAGVYRIRKLFWNEQRCVEMQKDRYYPGYTVFDEEDPFCDLMDGMRIIILENLRDICKFAGVEFSIKPRYKSEIVGEIKLGKDLDNNIQKFTERFSEMNPYYKLIK